MGCRKKVDYAAPFNTDPLLGVMNYKIILHGKSTLLFRTSLVLHRWPINIFVCVCVWMAETCWPTRLTVIATWHGWASGWGTVRSWRETLVASGRRSSKRFPCRTWPYQTSAARRVHALLLINIDLCYVFTVGWFTALCVCDVGRSRGSELRAAHPVSLGVHLSGDRGPLQQQTPARLTQRNPAQRHRAVSRRSELHYICPCIVSSIKECIFASKKGGNHSQSELVSC